MKNKKVGLIEDVSTIKTKEKKAKKKRNIIITGATLSVALIGAALFFAFSSDPHKEEKEAIKEVYEKVDVQLKDDDFVVEDNQVEVVEDKKEEARVKSSSALKQINSYITKTQLFGNGGESSTISGGSDDSGDVVVDDVSKKINSQLEIAKGFMERSFVKEYYGEPLKQLIADIKAGNTSGDFDYMSNCTNAKAYGVLCTVIQSCSAHNINDWVWTEDFLFSSIKESNVYYKLILNAIYNNSYTVDVLVPDTSKTFNITGHETTSSYLALCGNTSFYLDAECNILDVG